MAYKIIRHDKESDEITEQSYSSYNEAYDLLEEIYSDVCCSDADYGDRPHYEIIEKKMKLIGRRKHLLVWYQNQQSLCDYGLL